ncbi:MAG: tRNA glutamyl-Q(34) synthetase GluQRS [Succinivibrio sp.]
MPPVFFMYIGRFAPSPSGRLHLGSLLCATGSYLKARSQGGKWLVRIEDLDTPRCPKEYTKIILDEIQAFGFKADEKPYIQSEHKDNYKKTARALLDSGAAYYCNCTRAYLKDHECLCYRRNDIQEEGAALCLHYEISGNATFKDSLLGDVNVNKEHLQKRVCLIRRDKLISYNLGCVTDDILQGVTEIVRGSDLIDVTPLQNYMYESLKISSPQYLHLPLVMEDEERKLSKQNHSAPVISQGSPSFLLVTVLEMLNQDTSNLDESMSPEKILDIAIERFNQDLIPRCSIINPLQKTS